MPKTGGPPLTALLAITLVGGLPGAPVPVGVTPSVISSTQQTSVSVSGSGFEPGAQVALLDGGPALEATYFFPEGARGVEVSGTHACVASYSHNTKLGGITILDISRPEAPALLGAFETGDSGVAVQTTGSLAYIAFMNPYTFLGGMHVVDASDPADPIRLGTYYTLLDPQAIKVGSGYAWIADSYEGLKVVDLADPENPVQAGLLDTAGSARDLELQGETLWLADGPGGLLAVSAVNPAAMTIVGSYAPAGINAVDVAVRGDRLYLADAATGLLVLDISDPASPSLLGRAALPEAPTSLALDGDYAYVAAGSSGLQVVDLVDPLHPVVVGSEGLMANSGYFVSVAVSGGRAYVADLINGLQVIDIRRPMSPRPEVAIDLPGSLGAVMEGDVAWVARGDLGLAGVDLSAPVPSLRAAIDTPGFAEGIAANDRYLYVADGGSGLRVFDVADPLAPLEGVALDTAGSARAVAVEGGRAFIADDTRGLTIADLGNPLQPAFVASLDTLGNARALRVAGGYVYVADDFRGLQIIDARQPGAPVAAGRLDTPGRACGVVVRDGIAYVADFNRGLQIINVSNPAAPTLITNLPTPATAAGLELSGDQLFVMDGYAGVLQYDLSDPRAPELTSRRDTPGVAVGAAVAGGRLLVADGPGGLQLLRFNPRLPSAQVLSDVLLTFEAPAGLNPGPYDLMVRGPGGDAAVLSNAMSVCAPLSLSARLAPAGFAGGLPLSRLELAGDESLFAPTPRHEASLLLPALPGHLEVQFTRGTPRIDLYVYVGRDEGVLMLRGFEREPMERLWNEIQARGGVDLPRVGDRAYGDFSLAAYAAAATDLPGGAAIHWQAGFTAGALAMARMWGDQAGLVFQVRAEDRLGCGAIVTTMLRPPSQPAKRSYMIRHDPTGS